MARCLALAWDTSEARVAVARYSSREVVIEHAFTVPIAPRDLEQTFVDVDAGQLIAGALAERRLTGLDALTTIGRGSIELRLLTLPPAPDGELPDLVRFQAQSQFATLGSDWALDFLPLDEDATSPRNVLAAGISPQAMRQYREACETAKLRPRKLLLRSCAAASLLGRQTDRDAPRIRLMVDLLAAEADLTVLIEGAVVFMRTVRLAGEPGTPERSQLLGDEIRRTMAAAHNQLGGEQVQQIVMFGAEAEEDQRAVIQDGLDLPVVLCNPFADLAFSRRLRDNLPTAGGFAPLLGALLDEAEGTRHAIDFLHPRQKPPPRSQRRLAAFAVATAAAVFFAIGTLVWWQLGSLDARITELEEDRQELDEFLKDNKKPAAQTESIDTWTRGEVVWLDELAEISERFPDAESSLVTRLVTLSRRTGGEVVLDGYANQPPTIEQLESSLRSGGYEVFGSGGQYDARGDAYPWRFKQRVMVRGTEPESREDTGSAADSTNKQETGESASGTSREEARP